MQRSMTLRLNDHSIRLPTGEVNDYLEQLEAELEKSNGQVVEVAVSGLANWTPDEQDAIWRVCRVIADGGCRLCLKLAKQTYDDPVAAMVDRLVGPKNIFEHEQRLQSAIRAAAVFCSEAAQDAAAGLIVERLKALHVQVRSDKIRRLVREADCADDGEAVGPNPTILAEDFVEWLRGQHDDGLGEDDLPAHYFNGQFYLWDRPWREVATKEFVALVTSFLQDTNIDKVTTKLVNDVVANLGGLAVVGRGDEPLPFYVDDYGPPVSISRRQLLVFDNGMLDLEAVVAGGNAELEPLSPRWFSTVRLPFAFNPKARCPRFLRFLYDVLELDPESGRYRRSGDRRFRLLQEWFGYNLLGDGRFQRFVIMVGEGSNGKGVILNLLSAMLGSQNVCHVALDQLGGTFGLEPLLGKVANICGDLNEIDAVAEGLLKRLTGEDNLTVNRKNKTAVTMAPALKLSFATNTLPRFKDKTRGIWRRLIAMPFDVVIPEEEQDEGLATSLEEELPGILNWALRGLRRLLEQGRFTRCAVCEAAKVQHRQDCDPFLQFLDECVELGPRRRIDKRALYEVYRNWCDASRNRALAYGSFVRRVGRLAGVGDGRHERLDPKTGRREYYFIGIGLPLPMPQRDPSPPRRPRRCRASGAATPSRTVQNSGGRNGRP